MGVKSTKDHSSVFIKCIASQLTTLDHTDTFFLSQRPWQLISKFCSLLCAQRVAKGRDDTNICSCNTQNELNWVHKRMAEWQQGQWASGAQYLEPRWNREYYFCFVKWSKVEEQEGTSCGLEAGCCHLIPPIEHRLDLVHPSPNGTYNASGIHWLQ